MKYKLLLLLILVLLISGCSYSSSFEDCMWECKHEIHNDICTDITDWWDGCTNEEAKERNDVCYNECRGID